MIYGTIGFNSYNIKVRKTLIAYKFLKPLNFQGSKLPFNICIAISVGAVTDEIYTVTIAFSICEVLL